MVSSKRKYETKITVIVVTIAISLIGFCWRESYKSITNGICTIGQIETILNKTDGAKGIQYSFMLGGRNYISNDNLHRKDYSLVQIRSKYIVKFDPKSPMNSILYLDRKLPDTSKIGTLIDDSLCTCLEIDIMKLK